MTTVAAVSGEQHDHCRRLNWLSLRGELNEGRDLNSVSQALGGGPVPLAQRFAVEATQLSDRPGSALRWRVNSGYIATTATRSEFSRF